MTSLPPSYFDRMYGEAADPWGMAERWYEQRKYALTLAALPEPRYRSGFEPGCSIGVLTAQLATRCDALLATDVAAAAVAATRGRTADHAHVSVQRRAVPDEWPAGCFDLVVLSEVGYYLSRQALSTLLDRCVGALVDGGTLVAVHWRHPVADYPLSGDEVHEALATRPELARLARHEEEDFLLDVVVRGPAVSVAGRTGLL